MAVRRFRYFHRGENPIKSRKGVCAFVAFLLYDRLNAELNWSVSRLTVVEKWIT